MGKGRAGRGLAGLLLAFQVACLGAGDILAPGRALPGGYRLVQFEVYRYYVVEKGGSVDNGGVLGGSVERIGWDEHHIVAWRVAIHGQTGWMIIDVGTRRIAGPLSDEEWRQAAAQNPQLQSIRTRPTKEAWSML
jgi:hypothetical protein